MLANSKYRLIALITFALAGAVGVLELTSAEESNEARMAENRLQSFPLTIAVSWHGPTNIPGRMPMWFLSINSAGEGELTSRITEDDTQVSFKVSPKAMAAFRVNLVKDRFFELKDKYGDIRIHGSTVYITIVCGEFTKRVQIEDFGRALREGDGKSLREGSRAVRCAIVAADLYGEKLSASLKNEFKEVLRLAKE